jgi:predicted small secreted protein
MMSSFKIACLAIIAAFTLAACDNTIRGAGTDLNQSADAVQDTVQ